MQTWMKAIADHQWRVFKENIFLYRKYSGYCREVNITPIYSWVIFSEAIMQWKYWSREILLCLMKWSLNGHHAVWALILCWAYPPYLIAFNLYDGMSSIINYNSKIKPNNNIIHTNNTHKSWFKSSPIVETAVEQMEALFIKSKRNDEFNDGCRRLWSKSKTGRD